MTGFGIGAAAAGSVAVNVGSGLIYVDSLVWTLK